MLKTCHKIRDGVKYQHLYFKSLLILDFIRKSSFGN
jgi:hypothetical protein